MTKHLRGAKHIYTQLYSSRERRNPIPMANASPSSNFIVLSLSTWNMEWMRSHFGGEGGGQHGSKNHISGVAHMALHWQWPYEGEGGFTKRILSTHTIDYMLLHGRTTFLVYIRLTQHSYLCAHVHISNILRITHSHTHMKKGGVDEVDEGKISEGHGKKQSSYKPNRLTIC